MCVAPLPPYARYTYILLEELQDTRSTLSKNIKRSFKDNNRTAEWAMLVVHTVDTYNKKPDQVKYLVYVQVYYIY